jgi:hypothetical protein
MPRAWQSSCNKYIVVLILVIRTTSTQSINESVSDSVQCITNGSNASLPVTNHHSCCFATSRQPDTARLAAPPPGESPPMSNRRQPTPRLTSVEANQNEPEPSTIHLVYLLYQYYLDDSVFARKPCLNASSTSSKPY